jgi:hypothetical protein
MTTSTVPSTLTDVASRLRAPDRRIAAAWARLLLAAVVVLVPVAIVVAGSQSAHRAGITAVRAAIASVSGALTVQHRLTGGWPADLVAVGTSVVDTAGHRLATIPAGVAIDYQRSVDGSRVLVRVSDRGAEAAYDSAAAVR